VLRRASLSTHGRTEANISDAVVDKSAIEVPTEHLCVLGSLTARLASARDDDPAALAAYAIARLLRSGTFDRCCAPRYLALAPERGAREVQIPVVEEGPVRARVIVWPVGARDGEHPHVDGWTVFVPVIGELVTVEQAEGGPLSVGPLAPRRPVVLREKDHVRHWVRNSGRAQALSIHLSGDASRTHSLQITRPPIG
jgi:hypothetical protein